MKFDHSRVENIVMTSSRVSFLVRVTGEDPVYVIGNYCDFRGIVVNTAVTSFRKDQIALRLIVVDPRTNELPGPSALKFDHHTKDYVGV